VENEEQIYHHIELDLTTKMEKVYKAVARLKQQECDTEDYSEDEEEVGLDPRLEDNVPCSFRLWLGDQRIDNHHTPKELGLEDLDIIRCTAAKKDDGVDSQAGSVGGGKTLKRPRTLQSDGGQTGREQFLLNRPALQSRVGKKYCDESELVPLLVDCDVVRRVRTIQVDVRPVDLLDLSGGFKITLVMAKSSVGEAKAEIARVLNRCAKRLELSKVHGGRHVLKAKFMKPEVLKDDTMELKHGDIVTLAVKAKQLVVGERSQGEPITIQVRESSGEETLFKVKMTTRMEKVFNAFAKDKCMQDPALERTALGKASDELRFHPLLPWDQCTAQHVISGNQTPKELGLEDLDIIRCTAAKKDDGDDSQAGQAGSVRGGKNAKTAKRPRTSQPDGGQIGREQLLLTIPGLQSRVGKKFCDESELVPLLVDCDVVRRVRTIQVEVRPLGGDSFAITLGAIRPVVGKAMAEIARAHGTKTHDQELYKVAVRADGKAVREDDAEPEMLKDDATELKDGDIVALAVKQASQALETYLDLEKCIVIRVREPSGEETYFKIKMTTRMERVVDAFAHRKGIPARELRFFLGGRRIQNDQTPGTLGLEDQDRIEVLRRVRNM
jgi:small ubiquitin-related modifier